MPKRSSKPTRDENEAAFAAVAHIIQTTEETPGDRVLALERLCGEIFQFAEKARCLPERVMAALKDAARGRPVPVSLLPITTEDFSQDPPAVLLGRAGGLKGGAARASALSPKKRRIIAQRAAAARWAQKKSADSNKK